MDLTLLLRVAVLPGPAQRPPGQVLVRLFTPFPVIHCFPQRILPGAAPEGMLPRPELAGHHLQRRQGGGTAGDQYCPSHPVLLGHAHHGGMGLVPSHRASLELAWWWASRRWNPERLQPDPWAPRLSLSHLVPLVPLGQISGAGVTGDICRDRCVM